MCFRLISIGLNKMLLSKTKTGCDFVFGEFGINYRLLYRCEIVIEQRIRLSVSDFTVLEQHDTST
ncbi:hypothetical protein T4E_6202 [Trichinella pseudospiralis]|uniref:Uncharacterized protein n=1 Tax=Trichinella pseudospiralis TaxID=6337 RepID=A0A0V0XLY3_TRIPS|nr:hypothetical protein T4E_6202 [Trichinella pseudospiralis]